MLYKTVNTIEFLQGILATDLKNLTHASRDRLNSIHVEHLKEFIRENNLADEYDNVMKTAESNLGHIAGDEMKKSNNDKAFFVNTKFHFKNNSWTWVNGGQIQSNEWLFLPGSSQKYPIIPVQVTQILVSPKSWR